MSRAATCSHGLLRPAGSGQAFVHDPRVSHQKSEETKGKICLRSACRLNGHRLCPETRAGRMPRLTLSCVCYTGSMIARARDTPCPACSTSRTRESTKSRSSRYVHTQKTPVPTAEVRERAPARITNRPGAVGKCNDFLDSGLTLLLLLVREQYKQLEGSIETRNRDGTKSAITK